MSARGRGDAVIDSEVYNTPAWCTRRILEALPAALNNLRWLEPCAGDGAITALLPTPWVSAGDIRALNKPPLCMVMGWKPETPFNAWLSRFDVVITNPPFSLAPELIAHFLPRCDWLILLLRSSFKLVAEGRKGRPGHSYRDNMPDEYKLPQRPEFVASEKCIGSDDAKIDAGNRGENGEILLTPCPDGCGWERKIAMSEPALRKCCECGGRIQRSTTDSSEYSWFVWTPERGRKFGRTCVLPDTPLAERVADRGVP